MSHSGRSFGVAILALSMLTAVSCGRDEREAVEADRSAAPEPVTCESIAGEIATIDGKIDAPAWAGLRADLLAARAVLVKKATAHGCEATARSSR